MIPLTIEMDDTRLRARFDKISNGLKAELHSVITKETDELLARVQAAEPVRTGYLRSQTHAYVDEGPNFIRGRVRILRTGRASRAGAAFGALEYGAPGPRGRFPVRAYTRGSGPVRAYDRTAHIRARRFLRGSFEAMRQEIVAEIKQTAARAILK
jgi:hypothetical protein